jgi:hypothetical protein
MNTSNCQHCRFALDDLIDGYLSATGAEALRTHISTCPDCARFLARTQDLRAALRAMPVPAPRPGFEDRALAVATGLAVGHTGVGKSRAPRRGSWRRFELWAGTAIGAVAAAALMAVLLAPPQGRHEPEAADNGLRIALYEPREIGLAIDSENSVRGAKLTLRIEGGIDLVGFGERREISWITDLDAGTNLLSLPIIAHSLEEGRLTALVEHEGGVQQIDVRVRVDPAGRPR